MGSTEEKATGSEPAKRSPIFIVALAYWPMTCSTCGDRFMVETGSLAARIKANSPVCCSDGHANELSQLEQRSIIERLSDELTATRLELYQRQLLAARHRSAGHADPRKQMKIAARVMAASAEDSRDPLKRSGKICPICGFTSSDEYALKRHLLRQHKAELGGPATAE